MSDSGRRYMRFLVRTRGLRGSSVMDMPERRYLDVPTVIRFVLSLLLGAGVYSETGIWTTVWFFAVFAYIEVRTYHRWRDE